jgi:hypothetical protein
LNIEICFIFNHAIKIYSRAKMLQHCGCPWQSRWLPRSGKHGPAYGKQPEEGWLLG